MTELHPWVTTKLQPPIESSVLFRLPSHPNEVIRLDKEGFHYRGQFIEDAGEAHRLLVEFLRQGTAHAKAEQPVVPTDEEVHELYDGIRREPGCGHSHWGFSLEFARAVLAHWGHHPTPIPVAEQPVGLLPFPVPAFDDVVELCEEFGFELNEDDDSVDILWEIFRAVLARWGQPADV